MPQPSTPYPVIVHDFPSPTPDHKARAYEHLFPPHSLSPPTTPPENALVFIGGLGDGPHTVPYVRTLAGAVSRVGYAEGGGAAVTGRGKGEAGGGWSVFEVRLTSSFAGYGFVKGGLSGDVGEVDALVKYLRGTLGRRRVVVMGHSTGCQDCMEYANYEKHNNTPVDGFILQGPVSDREGIAPLMDSAKLNDGLAFAARLIDEGKGETVMPRDMLPEMFSTPITAYRWHSLAAVGGDDDYFSSDLPDEKVAEFWGRIQKPVLIVPSERDEHVPAHVDFEKLVARWKSFCRPGVASELSGLIPGANHTVDQADGQEWLADRVARFLAGLEE